MLLENTAWLELGKLIHMYMTSVLFLWWSITVESRYVRGATIIRSYLPWTQCWQSGHRR